MEIKKILFLSYGIIVLGLVFLMAEILTIYNNQKKVEKEQLIRLESYLIADELRQSSDDLTRLARLYVITGESKYKKMYNDILSIRNGDMPRPEHYEQVYWDLMLEYGEKPRPDSDLTRPLMGIMQDLGFSEEEFSLLEEASGNSDGLVKTEVRAMNTIDTLLASGPSALIGNPETFASQEEAIQAMHDDVYQTEKYNIMLPVNEFLVSLEERTEQMVEARKADLQRVMLLSGAAAVLILIMTIVIALCVGRIILKPLKEFQILFNQGATGDLRVRSKSNSKDGLGELGLQFNSFLEHVGSVISLIKDTAGRLVLVKEVLSTSTTGSSSKVSEIKNSTDVLLKKQQDMDSSVEDSGSAVQEIAANIENVSRQIQDQASMVEESTSAITEMMALLNNIADITQKKTEAIEKLAHVITEGDALLAEMSESFQSEVVERIEQVSEMVNVIESISAQTNLLSMNAAIEAAHAGDAGKGFAVVAEEIRKLADTTKTNSQTITETIQQISQGVSGTEKKTQGASSSFVTIQKQVQEARAAFEEISSGTREINTGGEEIINSMTALSEISMTIRRAANEMAAGAKQIVVSHSGLKQLSQSVYDDVQGISSGAQHIVLAIDEITKHSRDLDDVVSALETEISKFQV